MTYSNIRIWIRKCVRINFKVGCTKFTINSTIIWLKKNENVWSERQLVRNVWISEFQTYPNYWKRLTNVLLSPSFKHAKPLQKAILGNDCLLNFIDFGNLCSNLENFFRWIYSDCKTPGTKILKRLKHRCMRMNTILDMSVELYR